MRFLLILLLVVFFLIIVLLFLIKPNKRRDYSDFSGIMFAHRGLHDDIIPENSAAAFRLAVEKEYGVELDVQMTADGQLVVFHDGSLKRMTGEDGLLRNYTYDQLQTLHLKNSGERIPLFTDVLKILGTTTLICEIKSDNGNMNYELCKKTYECLAKYKGRYCIESFSPYLVRWFRIHHPQVIRGQLSCNMYSQKHMIFLIRFAMTHLLVNCISRPDFIAYCHKDTKKLGFVLCKCIYHPLLFGWTTRGTKEQEAARPKFNSLIFEQKEQENPIT